MTNWHFSSLKQRLTLTNGERQLGHHLQKLKLYHTPYIRMGYVSKWKNETMDIIEKNLVNWSLDLVFGKAL